MIRKGILNLLKAVGREAGLLRDWDAKVRLSKVALFETGLGGFFAWTDSILHLRRLQFHKTPRASLSDVSWGNVGQLVPELQPKMRNCCWLRDIERRVLTRLEPRDEGVGDGKTNSVILQISYNNMYHSE